MILLESYPFFGCILEKETGMVNFVKTGRFHKTIFEIHYKKQKRNVFCQYVLNTNSNNFEKAWLLK